jgi:hypothetical protein
MSVAVAASEPEPRFSKEELYTGLVNSYESDLLEKRAALSKCVTTACAVYAQLDITRLNSKITEIKAIYAHMNEIYAAKEGK